jgi:sn-glycerol 3-phosphate transport system substrate-binding protein
MKKASLLLSVILIVATLATTFSATPAYTQSATNTPAPTLTSVPPVPKKEGAIELTFWYGLGGLLGNVVQETVNKYNSSQSKYYVKAVFQASYDDTINKINAGLASGDLPNLAQVFDAGTQRMIDTGKVVLMQDLFERDGLTAVLDDIEPAVRQSYTINGKLVSAPFNSSTAMLYINRKAFAAAGLDPDKKFWTFADIRDAAKKLTIKSADGKTTQYGITIYPESWFFEQMHAAHDKLYGEPANGRAERMTKYSYNADLAVDYLNWQKSLIDDGSALYYGASQGSTAAGAAFTSGQAAMVFSSIASLRTLISGAERAGNGVEVGVVYLPRRSENDKFRTVVGGASLWITTVGTKEQQDGAWDFVKWALTPEIQAFWASNTGYYPVVRKSYDDQIMKDALTKYPQFQVAIEQLRLSDITPAGSFHVSGVFVSMRQDVNKATDDFLTGKVATAKEALDSAVASSNEKLEDYNATIKK